MVSVCLPSDALLQHLPSYMGFSYLGRGVSLHGRSSRAQPPLLTLDEGYLLTAPVPDLQRGIAPLGPPVPAQPQLLGLLLPATCPGLGRGWLFSAALSAPACNCRPRFPPKKWSSHHGQQKSLKHSTWMQSQKRQNDLCLSPKQTIQYHSYPSLCPNQ